jgi:hypothetical protein
MMGTCACNPFSAVFSQSVGTGENDRPEEWRVWLRDSAASRQVFNEATQRMVNFIQELAQDADAKADHFKVEEPRIDQYFLTDHTIGAKAATRDGKASLEVKRLLHVSAHGSEAWEKATGIDLSKYTQLPWVSLEKSRKRAKLKKIVKKTSFQGLKAFELTEVKVVQDKVHPEATGPNQPLKDDSFLSIAVEGTPDAISKAVETLQLVQLETQAFLNPEVEAGLYKLNVSYPRFLSLCR